jgi:NNP family nitrate/nitrite transporter-like MFS transporter
VTIESGKRGGWASFRAAAANYRVWMLFITYGACFGVEIFIHNIAAIYYVDHFQLSLESAGMAAASFGLLALFARALGGYISDKVALRGGLNRRATLLFVLMLGEGLGLLWFAHAGSVVAAVVAMLCFGLFTHMACGATYALVPFIDRKALGGVAGIIGAGGNVGAVAAGFLMKGLGDTQQTLSMLGVLVTISALCAVAIRFTASDKSGDAAWPTAKLQPEESTHEDHRHRPRHGRPQVPGMPGGKRRRRPARSRCCAKSRARPTTAYTCPNSSPARARRPVAGGAGFFEPAAARCSSPQAQRQGPAIDLERKQVVVTVAGRKRPCPTTSWCWPPAPIPSCRRCRATSARTASSIAPSKTWKRCWNAAAAPRAAW